MPDEAPRPSSDFNQRLLRESEAAIKRSRDLLERTKHLITNKPTRPTDQTERLFRERKRDGSRD